MKSGTGEMPTIAIIAGGLATRLRPLTNACPKALIPVAGEPFVFQQLRILAANGFRSVVFLIGHLGEQIVETVGDGSALGLTIRYQSDGPKLLGTGGSIARALPLLGDEFCTIYGDSWLDFDYAGAVRHFRTHCGPALMTVISANTASEAANVEYSDGKVLRYNKIEHRAAMRHIDYGFGMFAASVFAGVPVDQPTDLAWIQQQLADQGRLLGFEAANRYYEVGSLTGRHELEEYLLTQHQG